MKAKFLLTFLLFFAIDMVAQEYASLTISNSLDYTFTIKIMKTTGGLFTTLYIPAHQSRTAYFSRTGWFYTKTKAERARSATLYKKDAQSFKIVCDETGYSEASITYYVSEGAGNAGQSISKSEFENDNK